MTKAGDLSNVAYRSKPIKYLQKILHSSVFCTVCLEINDDLLYLNDLIFKGDWEGDALPIRDVLDEIFGPNDILFSEYICKPCKSAAASSYSFISRTKRTAETLTKYLKQLDKETTDLASRIMIDNDWKNAMIVLEDHSYKKTETVKPKKRCMAPTYICDLCGKKFLRKQNLIKHFQQHNSLNVLECPHCVSRPCMHEKHILAFNEETLQKIDQMTCIECGEKIMKTLPDLIAHVNKKHLNVTSVCKECGTSFYKASHYKKHFDYHHNNKHVCKLCFRKFRSEKQLNTHMESCKNTLKSFKCSQCPVLSETELINKLHMSTHSSGYAERQMKHNPKSGRGVKRIKKTYECSICKKVLKKQQELRAHVRMHGKKPNLCLYCNKQFASRQEYLDHVQTDEHRKKVPYNTFKHHCLHCDYASNTVAMLEAHVNRIHLSVRPFKCEHCQKAYFDAKQLKNHMKIHTGQVKLKVCDICGAHLAGPTALKKHRRIHTGERPYPCPYCDIKATCATTLKTHIMRKHMEATISCPLCGTKFHTMTNAREHVKKTHWKSKEKFDYTKLKGLAPKDYDFFRDRRKALL